MNNADNVFEDKASLWIGTTPKTVYPSLSGDFTVDAAIVGGGIVGITVAVLLKKAGARVAVLEANEIAKGVSGHTTAKITSAHGMIYHHLISHLNVDEARQYAAANQSALEFIAAFIAEDKISCDFTRTFACTYSPEEKDDKSLRDEAAASMKLGLPAGYVESASVPFPFKGGVCFENQAFFHPRKYLLALAAGISGNGSHLFEHTRVMGVEEGNPCRVITDKGVIKANQVIVATHFPILNRGLYFSKMIPRRSYAAAFQPRGEVPEGMYYSIAPPYHTFRKHVTDTGDVYLLAGGEDHVTGKVRDTRARFDRLESFVRRHFDVQSVRYRWSTQDNDSLDRIPFIGTHAPFSRRVYTATGFMGWGMTNGTAAAMILSDLIAGRDNPWASLFDPGRTSPYRTRDFVLRNMKVAGTFVRDHIKPGEKKSVSALSPGEGGIVQNGMKKMAAFKEKNGIAHVVSPRCTHMYCQLEWNNFEESWDCPCHGSRFTPGGSILHAPAVKDLENE